ncbi:MAG TPA: hypothetical protein VEO37_01115, partial [Thermoanaerobaculia bacterium]|nr:hypothetical protein [Thermoanaerobaculia bacterium]
QRNLDTEGLSLSVTPQKGADDGKRVARIRIEILLPPEFPEKYREAILRAVDQCSVKRHLAEPPQFDVFAIAARQQAETPPGTSPVESIASSSR